MKISVCKVRKNGGVAWMVSHRPPGGKRKRVFFQTRSDADAEKARLTDQQSRTGEIWMSLSASRRDELVSVSREAEQAGINLREAVAFYREQHGAAAATILCDALRDFLNERGSARLSRRTLSALKSNVGRFTAGRERMALTVLTRSEVLTWLNSDGWSPRTFNSYLASLKTFFRWCVATGRLVRSPVESINPIGLRQMPDIDTPPSILCPDKCQTLLQAAQTDDPGLVPYLGVCLFAGLRPEREAGSLTWQDIRGDAIAVKGLHAKTRQRRDVPITETLRVWLALGGDLPVRNRRKRFEAIRLVAGIVTRTDGKLAGWEQDAMRHTFASNYLSIYGAEKTAAALGHGDYDMLFRHYREIVTPDSAAAFWSIKP